MSGYQKFTIQSIICDRDDVGIDRSATVSSVILLGLNLHHMILVNKCVLVCMRHQHAVQYINTYALTLQLQLEEVVEFSLLIEIWKEIFVGSQFVHTNVLL